MDARRTTPVSGSTTATIRVSRDRARGPDRRRAYLLFVDNGPPGELHRGDTTDVAVPPGRHVLRVSVDDEHSREWECTVAAGDVVTFLCRSRRKHARHVDLFLANPGDERARLRPLGYDPERDLARKQRVVTRDGQVLAVWAHRSGYLRSLDPGSSSDPDAFWLELVLYIVVLPVLALLRWVRHRLLFKRGWSVGVVRQRRWLWPKKVRLERFRSEGEARARAAELIAELER